MKRSSSFRLQHLPWLGLGVLFLTNAGWSAEDATTTSAEQSKDLARLTVPSSPVYPTTCSSSVSGEVIERPVVAEVAPPTAEQIRAFGILQSEAKQFTAEARDFRNRLTTIVRHHYEDRRKKILASIDKEVAYERQSFEGARDEAIARLEAFIQQYSGQNADPQATPDAMFRLAALYEERARENYDADLSEGLLPSIALYRDVVAQYPAYRERAAVLYYLGHALTDAGRLAEAQQSWRSLVCSNRYHVEADPSSADKIRVQALPQDHTEAFWNEWYNKNPIPLDQRGTRPDLTQLGAKEEELTFVDPYAECQAVPQDVAPGEDPRYVAEVWWQLGNYHFDLIDRHGGPYTLNRAVSAYEKALEYKKPPLYGVAMYKQAWTFFKQQRYHTAVDWFVQLLHYADEQEEKTGDPGADFRAEAFTYIAGSLTYVDFEGPLAQDPQIPRSDVLDLEPDPLRAEEKMRVAIERVQNPELIPQDKKWTVDIYKALAQEYIEIMQNRNAILALELTIEKFPLDRDVPVMLHRSAELYDQIARLAPQGSEARNEYARKALEARSKLSQYVGTTTWTNANRDDPEAIAQAEELVRGGLRRAAADHTNYARAYKERAFQLSDANQQRALLEQAIDEYRLAAQGWGAYLEQDPHAMDSYESRFWLADAHFWTAVLQVPLGKKPTQEEIDRARQSAATVRDSNEDDKYKQPAAYYLVTLAEKILDAEAQIYEETEGAQGLLRKESVSFSGEEENRTVVKEELPAPVVAAVCARDEYNARIPLSEDPEQNGLLYASQAAEYFFVYGQFEEARRRFVPIYEKYCGKNQWGYNAWEKLVSMSNFSNNAEESRKLVDSRSCAFDEDSRLAEEALRTPVRQGVAYLEARKLFEEAMAMEDGPERNKKWRAAAAAYKQALSAGPERDEAPEAAMNGAYSYKQVGEYDQAIAMYSLFISKYGDSQTLKTLKKEEPARYEERVGFLTNAYQALASAYILFFDYPKAADTFDKIAEIEDFPKAERQAAAKQALTLYANLDDSAGMQKARRRYANLGASEENLSEADFLIAGAALKKWDPESPDTGSNKQARLSAQQTMEQYYTANRNRRSAYRYAVQAAYHVAVSKRAGRAGNENEWWNNTISAFDRYLGVAPQKDGKSSALGSEEANMAAEAEFTLIDQNLKSSFDYDSGHHRFKGSIVEVTQQYTKSAQTAKTWYDKLQRVVDRYVSPKWATVAIARQGSLYDSIRTGLYNTRPPELKMFTDAQEKMLRQAEESDNDDLIDKADEIRLQVNEAWRQRRDQELDGADRIAVEKYATAVQLAQRYNLSAPAITRAIRRLAFLTEVAGEAKMSEYTANNKELNYTPGMFQRMRPGVISTPSVEALPPAAPPEVTP